MDVHPPACKLSFGISDELDALRRGKLTAFLKPAFPMCFFFLLFIGSSICTRELRIWISLSVKISLFGKKVL